MATIPLWLIGRDVAVATLTVQSVNASTGVLTDATGNNDVAALHNTSTGIGLLDEISVSYHRRTENISAINRVNAHHYPTVIATEITLTEILRAGHLTATTPYSKCLLGNAWHAGASAYVKVVVTRALRTWTLYGVMESYEERLVRGKNVARLTIRMVDSATAPALA